MAREPRFDDGFSEMLPAPPSAGIGHNQGPAMLPIGEELNERLAQAHKDAMDRGRALLRARKIPEIKDQAGDKKATERVRQIQASLTELDGQRKAEKEPYRLGGAQVDGFFNEVAEDLEIQKREIEKNANEYKRQVRETARKAAAAELAKKIAAEAEARRVANAKLAKAAAAAAKAKGAKTIAKAAIAQAEANEARDVLDDAKANTTRAERQLALPAADLTRTRSSNAVSSQQEFVDFTELDRKMLSLEDLRAHFSIADLEVAIRSYIKANNDALKTDIKNRRQPLRGVVFFMNDRTRVGGG